MTIVHTWSSGVRHKCHILPVPLFVLTKLFFLRTFKKVKLVNDQVTAQSERKSHSKNRDGKN